MTGYQEILTDPSYAGQIVIMTAPQIGNTGINAADDEARRAFLKGFVVRDLSRRVSNWRAESPLGEWLAAQDVPGITDIDTRALTRRIRERGSMKAIICTDSTLRDETLIRRARDWPGLEGVDLVQSVTCANPYQWSEETPSDWAFWGTENESQEIHEHHHIVAYDFGIKQNILRRLCAYGCRVTVIPAQTPAAEILAMKPDGVLLSNGPGDPAAVTYAVEAARELIGKVPIFGICLGHQIIGQALGGRTYKLKFGHHGGNQPVKHTASGRVEISAHNHNFAVDAESLPDEVAITHINLNDGCCEGLCHERLPVLSVQYHPEAAPGPHDADPLFEEFIRIVKEKK
jgi:carbamoyl-phosphate synthase small subunit